MDETCVDTIAQVSLTPWPLLLFLDAPTRNLRIIIILPTDRPEMILPTGIPPSLYIGGLSFQNFPKKGGSEFSHKKEGVDEIVKFVFSLKKREGITNTN